MKTCFKCGNEKPIDEFYRHKGMADGRLGKCKECAKADVAANRLENIDRVRAYDRDRAKRPERAAAAAKYNKAWRAADKRRGAAHSAVARAIRSGRLVREPCVVCGDPKSVAHHQDYDRKLDVTWLCQPCHVRLHKHGF